MSNDSHLFDWLESSAADGTLDLQEVKEESQTDLLLSSPSSSFTSPLTTSVSLHLTRKRSTKSASPRVRPYPERSEDTIGMSGTSGYGDHCGRPRRSVERRSSEGDQPSYGTSSCYGASRARHTDRSPPSSSLSGAVGSDASVMQTRYMSPRPRSGTYNQGMHQMSWTSASVNADPSMLPGVPGDIAYLSSNASHDGRFENYNIAAASSTSFPNAYDMIPMNSTTFPSLMNSYTPSPNSYSLTDLQHRVAELEQIERQDKERIRNLEAQLSRSGSASQSTPVFEASWRARTEARIRQFCSLNRAGNALCAWHDSRRERRMYPPRMAPPGTLNCGCTFEEALFEESLSRHNVGSYLPGESVRMDPALRNPLLKLLQERYAYRDGDFERDPHTGSWLQGEGPAYWEQQIATGVNPRRPRGEQNR